jgi:two-component system, NarL family, nitrate/nitrite response regulator NarL
MLGVTILPAAFMRLLGGENEMDSEDDPAVPAAQTHVPIFNHTVRTLSDREMGILRCLMHGESNKSIARQFDITEAPSKPTSRRSYGRFASAIALRRLFGRTIIG